MAKFGNRVKETSATTGTGTLDLAGAPTGFRAFADEFNSGDTVYYLLVDDVDNPTQYEYGIGTFTNAVPDTLARTTVHGSSNGGSKVSWIAGCTVVATPTALALNGGVGFDLAALAQTLTMSGKSIIEANSSVAAHATTAAIWTAGNYVTLTGSAVTFTDFADAPQAGAQVELYCNAAHVFTDNANLEIDGDANFTAEAGDRIVVRAKSTSVFTLQPIKKTGAPVDAAGALDAATLRGHIAGLTLSNNGTDANNDIDIAAGAAIDGAASDGMKLASALTKRLDAAWAVGTNQGGLDTGSKASGTWYHLWLIKRSDTGVVDVLFSTSATAPTMPANYNKKRRIGSVKTDGSSNILAFKQVEETFYLATQVLDLSSTSLGTSANLVTLSVPTGIKLRPLYRAFSEPTAAAGSVIITSPDETDVAPNTVGPGGWSAAPGGDILATGNASRAGNVTDSPVYTNTSGQVRVRTDTAGNKVQIVTRGWIDSRGRYD